MNDPVHGVLAEHAQNYELLFKFQFEGPCFSERY